MEKENSDYAYRWVILSLSSLLIIFVFMAQILWSVGLKSENVETGDIQDSFGGIAYSIAMLGFSIPVLTQGIGNFFQGIFINKFGFKKTFVIFFPFFLIPQFVIPFLPNLIGNPGIAWKICLMLRGIQGLGIIFGVLSPLVGCWFTLQERGLAQGIFMTAVGINSGIGAVLAWALSSVGLEWQGTFIILGILALFAGVLWLVLVKEPPLYIQEKKAVELSGATKKNIFFSPATWMVVWLVSMNCWVIFGIVGNAAPYLETIGYTGGKSVLGLVFLSLATVIATPMGGKLSDSLILKIGTVRARTFSLMVGFLLAAVFAILFPYLAPFSFPLALFSVFMASFGGPWTSGTVWSLPADFGADQAGKISGIALIVGQAVGFCSSQVVSVISGMDITNSWGLAFVVLGVVAAMGVIPAFLLRKYAL
jgi:MFS family permease